MSISAELLRRRLQRFAAGLKPELLRELLNAWELHRDVLGPGTVFRLLTSGTSIERLVKELLSDEVLTSSFARLTTALSTGSSRAAARYADLLPAAMRNVATFNTLNPRVIDGILTLNARVITRLGSEVRLSLREHVLGGLNAGLHPKVVARTARSIVGLTPNQVGFVTNFDRMLREGDRQALSRALRDHRFDSTLQRLLGAGKPGIADAPRARMVNAYRRRLIAHNAETHVQTAALQAHKLGNRLSWEDAISRGMVERTQLFKRWSNSGDARVREEHLDGTGMGGEEVPFDEPYSNGENIAGESTFRCRCIDIIFVKSLEAIVRGA